MGDVTKLIIRPMTTMYGDLGTDDVDMVLDVYERQLAGFPDEILRTAFDEVVGKFFPSKRMPWPAPAAFKKACEAKQQRKVQPGTGKAEKFIAELHAKRASSRRWATDWVKNTPLGRQSITEGWCRSLHNEVAQIHYAKTINNEGVQPSDIQVSGERIGYWRRHMCAVDPQREAMFVLNILPKDSQCSRPTEELKP